MLKWIKRVGLGVVALTVVVIVSGIAFEQWSRWSVSRDYKPVGQLFEVDGGKMHLNCSGKGAPTVVFESGMGEDSTSWSDIHPEIAKTTRVCSYDRVGRLWSDGSNETLTAAGTAARLHGLLNIASEAPPYVVVGHSLGGPLVMVFADQYPRDVVGAVLVDSAHPDQFKRYPPEVDELSNIDGWDRVLFTIKAETGLMRLSMSGVYDGISYEELASVKYLPQSMPAIFAEMDAADQMIADAGETTVFGEMPLIILSAGSLPRELPPEFTPEILSQFEKAHAEMQIELASLSTRGEQRVIADASHHIHYGNPDAVILAIRDVVTAAQESGRPD